MSTPTTRYAKSDVVHVAYQEFGLGDVNVVIVPGFVSRIDNYWTHPELLGTFVLKGVADEWQLYKVEG